MNPFARLRRLWSRGLSAPALRTSARRRPRLAFDDLENRLAPAVLTVNSTLDNLADDANLTLREAILLVNSGGNANTALGRAPLSAGETAQINTANPFGIADTIEFNIAGVGLKSIQITGAQLPAVAVPLLIDGYSQPGTSENALAIGNNAVLLIEIDGSVAPAGSDGLTILTSNSVVQGLVINGFNDTGIVLSGNANVVRGNFLGTNDTGTAPDGNDIGIHIFLGQANTIGGTATGDRNLISGNRTGALIATGFNTVQGNYIGTNDAGTAAIPNTESGIEVDSANNIIGGSLAGAGNLLSGNFVGIAFVADGDSNLVQGNLIGTNADGAVALGNGIGVALVAGATMNVIGTNGDGANDDDEGNLISGNAFGILVLGDSNSIAGNLIGTDVNGMGALPNGIGINVDAAFFTIIGGSLPAQRNVISGNTLDGVRLTNNAAQTTVLNNYIGVNALGFGDLGNGESGVAIFGASFNSIGDATDATRNVISGNGQIGVHVKGPGSNNNLIVNNFIGTDATGIAPIPNDSHGVLIWHDLANNPATQAPQDNTVRTNRIAFNTGTGIVVGVGVTDLSPSNRLDANRIYGNAAGIDLGFDGPTTNDAAALDADTGPNGLQNRPVLLDASATQVFGSLQSTANTTYTVQLFANAAVNPADTPDVSPVGISQGEVYLGSVQVTTDAAGNVAFTFDYTFDPALPYITATATDDLTLDTSEFSYAVNHVASQIGYTIVGANILVAFDLAAPRTYLDSITISGLQPGETIEGIDFRPADGRLYALGIVNNGANNVGRLYTINIDTGLAVNVRATDDAFSSTLVAGATFGFDFNPAVDRIRVVSSAAENFRLHPDTGALLGPDTALGATNIFAAAYDRNDNDPSSATTLYAINSNGRLLTIGSLNGSPASPNGGAVTEIGFLGLVGIDPGFVGFDITGNTGYMIANEGGGFSLFTVNLATGAATNVDLLGNGSAPIRSFAIPTNVFANLPQATDDTFTTKRNAPLVIAADGVLLNDYDPTGAPLTATAFSDPANGTVIGNPDGSFTYTPDANFVGTDTFTYQATRGLITSAATVTIHVLAPNKLAVGVVNSHFLVKFSLDNPTVILDTVAVEGMSANERLSGVDFRPATGDLYGLGTNRVYKIDINTGDTTFVTLAPTPADDNPFAGLTTDDYGFDFNPVPDRLRLVGSNGQNLRINVDTGLVITDGVINNASTGVIAAAYTNNFSGASTTTLHTIDSVNDTLNTQAPPNDGTTTAVGPLGIDVGNIVSFDISGGTGIGYFTATDAGVARLYSVNFTSGAATPLSIIGNGTQELQGLALALGNAAPVAAPDAFTTNEDQPLTIVVANSILNNDTDADGDPLTVGLFTQPANGTVAVNANGTFTYTPNEHFNGTDSFTYRANDGTANSFAAATVTITVTSVNDAPVGVADGTYTVAEDGSLVVPVATGVLNNDTDVEMNILTVTSNTQPAHGSVTVNPDGSFTYTPVADYFGPDSFTYIAQDGPGDFTAATTVTLSVTAVADITADSLTTRVGLAVTANVITGTNSATADTFENAGRAITSVTQGTNGAVTFTGPGSVTYTPTGTFSGTDSFNYTVTSGGATETATVTVLVNAIPTAIAVTPGSVAENAGANASAGTLSATDANALDTFTFLLVSGTGETHNAQFNILGNQLRATASLDFEAGATRSVRVQVTDSAGNVFAMPLTIAVTNVNELPTDITLAPSAIVEFAGPNAVVGTLTATDPDAAETFTFALVGTGDAHNAAFNISGNQLRANDSLKFADGATRSVRVQVTDSANNTYVEVLTIGVTSQQLPWKNVTVTPPAVVTNLPGDANAKFVRDLYGRLLGREATNSEVTEKVNLLNGNQTAAAIVNTVYKSSEHRLRQANYFYTRILGRAGTTEEAQSFATALTNGVTEQQVIKTFLLSAEFQAGKTNTQFVNSLYTVLLNRTADAGEPDFWVNTLAAGASRESVVNGFLGSKELLTREIGEFYTGYLGRPADQGGLTIWLNSLDAKKTTLDAIAKNILSSAEFVSKPR